MKKLLLCLTLLLSFSAKADLNGAIAHYGITPGTNKPALNGLKALLVEDVYYGTAIYASKVTTFTKPFVDASRPACDENRGDCFQVFAYPLTYTEADALCKLQGANLANANRYSYTKIQRPMMESLGAKFIDGFHMGAYIPPYSFQEVGDTWDQNKFDPNILAEGSYYSIPTGYLIQPLRTDFYDQWMSSVYTTKNRGGPASYSVSNYYNGWRYQRMFGDVKFRGAICQWDAILINLEKQNLLTKAIR